MSMSGIQVRTDSRDVSYITLDRVARHNALDRELIDNLTASLDAARENARVLVLEARGQSFCAGADVDWLRASAELDDAANQADAMALSNLLEMLDLFPRPVVARVQGVALGGGVGLVCCCDIVVASERAEFAFSEVNLGMIPATISPYALNAISARSARRLFLTGERIDALQAYRMGLVHDVCSTADLDYRVDEAVENLLTGAPGAQTACKQLIADIAGRPIDQALRDDLAGRLANVRAGDEGQEGLKAFLEKRRPGWRRR